MRHVVSSDSSFRAYNTAETQNKQVNKVNRRYASREHILNIAMPS